jgi:hypothetical protein
MPSINRHFKREGWLMAAVVLGPIALGLIAAVLVPWFSGGHEPAKVAGSGSVDSPAAAIAVSRQAWLSIYQKTGHGAFKRENTAQFEPYSATLEDGVWIVRGTVAATYRGEVLVTRVRRGDGSTAATAEIVK